MDYLCFLSGPDFFLVGFFKLIKKLQIATKGDQKHYLLFDAGPEGEVWERNSRRLRADVGRIEHVALSHYHRDHSGENSMLICCGICSSFECR